MRCSCSIDSLDVTVHDREEVGEEPIKTLLRNRRVVETNAYSNSDRDLLQSAYDMYMKQHPKRKGYARS